MPRKECGGVLEVGFPEQVDAWMVAGSYKGIDLAEVQDCMSIVKDECNGLLRHAFLPCRRFEVDAYFRLGVMDVEVKEVDCSECLFGAVMDDESQLAVLIDVAGCVGDIRPKVLVREGVMHTGGVPCVGVVLHRIEERQVGRFYFPQPYIVVLQ